MAISTSQILTVILLLITLVATTTTTVAALGGSGGKFVGGRSEIENVKTNKEVQDLGKFSVDEYNKQQQHHAQFIDSSAKKPATLLMFKEVVSAQQQVVSGIKYYLKISANRGESHMLFDSVVVVKPWARSKEMLGFTPSH